MLRPTLRGKHQAPRHALTCLMLERACLCQGYALSHASGIRCLGSDDKGSECNTRDAALPDQCGDLRLAPVSLSHSVLGVARQDSSSSTRTRGARNGNGEPCWRGSPAALCEFRQVAHSAFKQLGTARRRERRVCRAPDEASRSPLSERGFALRFSLCCCGAARLDARAPDVLHDGQEWDKAGAVPSSARAGLPRYLPCAAQLP
jgi:hypothetical protein